MSSTSLMSFMSSMSAQEGQRAAPVTLRIRDVPAPVSALHERRFLQKNISEGSAKGFPRYGLAAKIV